MHVFYFIYAKKLYCLSISIICAKDDDEKQKEGVEMRIFEWVNKWKSM